MAQIENLYDLLPPKYKQERSTYENFDKIKINLPNRFLVVAPSGAGKTNLTLNLIILLNHFDKIWIFAKSFETEPLWNWFVDQIHDVEKKVSKRQGKPVKILQMISTDLGDLPEVGSFDKASRNLVVFDDQITETNKAKLKNMTDMWVRGRHRNITPMYLSQNYYDIPKIMRQNTGILILKDLGTERDKRGILSDVAKDKSMAQMQAMFNACETEHMTNFMLIDTTCGMHKELRYRKNFSPLL